MRVEDALVRFHADPEDSDAWETIVMSVYDVLLLNVASLLLSFRAATTESAADIVGPRAMSSSSRRTTYYVISGEAVETC